MSMAFRLYSGSLIYGDTGVSKQSTIRELVNYIGAQCVVYDCSIQFSMQQLGRILGGIVQCQAYVSMIGLEQVESDVFGLFVHQIKRLQHALKTHKEKILLDSALVSLANHNYGVFCKLTTYSEVRTTLMVRTCASAFVTFACKFSLPDVSVLIGLYLTCHGFRDVENLTKSLHSFLLLLGTTYCPCPGEFQCVRIVRKIVDLAARYLELFRDEDQVVAYAVWNSVGSRISPERKNAFLTLLHRQFPSFRYVDLDVSKTRTHIHEQMELRCLVPTPISTRKVAELHHLCSMYAINVVTGDISSGKSTTIELLSGLRRYAEGEQRVKCFRIATETLCPAEYYGHAHQDFLRDMVRNISIIMVRQFYQEYSSALENWSPSALSRFGIMYLPADGLPYTVFIKAWILRLEKANPPLDERILSVAQQLAQLMRSHLPSLIEVNKLVSTLHKFLEKLSANSPTLKADANLMYLCACTWTVGVVVKSSARPLFHEALMKVAPELKCHKLFTHGRTFYDVFWRSEGTSIGLASWSSRVHQADWSALSNHHHILIANETSVCVEHLVSNFAMDKRNVLLVGASGVGKSSLARRALITLSDRNMTRVIKIGKKTSAVSFQDQVILDLERKMKGLYGPCTGKESAIFHVEDMHLSNKECQEQLRQVVDAKEIYHRVSFDHLELVSLVFVALASLNPSSVMELPLRLLRHFHLIWIPEFSPDSIFQMFKSLPTCVLERFPVSLSLDACWKILQFPLLVLQAMWAHSFQSRHAIFTIGDVLDVYGCLLRSAKSNFESKSKLERVMLNLTAICFRAKSNFSDQDNWVYPYLTSPILSTLEFDTHDELSLYCFSNNGNGTSYTSISQQTAVNLFVTGDEKFQWHHPSFNESIVRQLVPFPAAVDSFLRVLIGLSEMKPHVLMKGPRGCGKRTTVILVCGILSFKYVEIRQNTHAVKLVKETLLAVGTNASNYIIYVAADELSSDVRQLIMHVLRDGDIPWVMYEPHELELISEAIKKLPSFQHMNPSKAQCYSQYRDNLKKHVHIALSLRNDNAVLDECVDEDASLLHSCSCHDFTAWSLDSFKAILATSAIPPLLHPLMQRIHESVLAAKVTMSRLSRLNTSRAFKVWINSFEKLHHQCRKRLDAIQQQYSAGLKNMKKLIKEIDVLNAKERKMAKALEVIGVESEQLHQRYEKQRAIEQKLHDSFADEERAYQVMKNAIDEEKRNLQCEIDQTVPEIQAAIMSLNKINKLHITEMKSFTSPPDLVRLVMQAVCVLLGHGASPTWDDALFVLCDMKFLDRLKFFDKDNIQDSVMRKLDKFIQHPKFNEEEMKRASIASTSLCRWVLAMVRYHTVMAYVRPKQAKLETAHDHVSRLECTVRAATEAWRVCEAKTKALHTAWKDNEAKKVELQTEFHHLRERTVAIDRVSIVFENIKPVLRKQLHHLKSADETIMGDCLVLTATSSYLGNVIPSQRVPLLESWKILCTASKIHTAPDMLQSTLGIEGVQELRAACSVIDSQILINLNQLNRWRRSAPYKTFSLLWDPAGIATAWIKSMERMGLEVISADDPMIMSRFEMTLPNSNIVILVDRVGQVNESVMWDLLQVLVNHTSKRPIYFVSEFDCSESWSMELVERFEIISFELSSSDLQEYVRHIFYLHFSAAQENECRILNERLLDDLNHRQTHVDHLLRQIALSQANLLTCEEDMMSLVTRMSLLTQSLGNIEIKTNALSQIEQSRSPFLEYVIRSSCFSWSSLASSRIGRRGLTLLDAAGTFGINKPHKCIAMLQYSITKLPMDVVLQPIGQICTHVTAAFIQEALHSLPSEVHLGFCFYVALGICEAHHPDVVGIIKGQITVFRNISYPGLHVMVDRSSPTITHAVASRVIASAIRACVDRIMSKRAGTIQALQMAKILDGSARVYITRGGKKRSAILVNLLSKWHVLFQKSTAFAAVVDDVDSFPGLYETFAKSSPNSVHDLPSTAIVSLLPVLVKFAMVALSHDLMTQTMLHDLVMAVIPGAQFPSTSIVNIAGQTDAHRPIALRYNADLIVHPLWSLVESAQSIGIREDEVMYFSLASPDAVSSALKTIKEAAFHGGWVILQDLRHIKPSEKAELTRQFEAIAYGDLAVNADFRLWLIHDDAESMFPTCNVKTYFFNTASMMPHGIHHAKGTLHTKYMPGILLFHSLVVNGLHAGSPAAASMPYSMYEVEQADFLLRTLCDEKEIASGIHAEEWTPAQVATVLVALYKCKTADATLCTQYDVLYRWCLEVVTSHSSTTEDTALSPQWQQSLLLTVATLTEFRTNLALPPKDTNANASRRSLSEMLPPPTTWLSATALGLPQSIHGYFDWEMAETTLSHLTALASQRPMTAIPTATVVDVLMFQLPKPTVFQHAARKAWHASSDTVEEVLWLEMLGMEKYLNRVWFHLRAASSTADGMLHRGFVAEWMLSKYAAPLRLRDWISWVQATVSMYQEWLWSLRLPLLRLQAFENPQALLIAVLEQYAVAHNVPVSELCLAALRPPSSHERPEQYRSLLVGHLFFRNAQWDGHQLSLLSGEGSDGTSGLIQRSSPLELFAWVRGDITDLDVFSCPVYTYYFTHAPAASWTSPIESTHVTTIYVPIPPRAASHYHAKGVVCVLNEAFKA
ncbi:hypothetical protein H310_03027 [Aphanomyces invadans]|uniref:Uncharacterized protein n=1 Tax=Aphanomyces invadans TaxID=157072 RepID=A0A024UM62_9STRA|nr:hypothetical protein H310_03027 [Aphanomyces invadans]ETW06912.1 hypothetical protein H310_03027 [Aphanomyces invadans]|eukprot:XP_008864987.1 hypothetical protein H310_03027 [Aphanomyces invadans]